MKKIKINFWNFFSGFDSPEGFCKLFPFLKDRYEFVLDDYPDFLIYSNGSDRSGMPNLREQVAADVKLIFFDGEYLPKIYPQACNWSFTCHHIYEDDSHYRLPYYMLRLMYTEQDPNDLIKDVDEEFLKHIVRTRTKFCNFIYSNPVEFRNAFFDDLSQYKIVDSYGACKNNMGRQLSGRSWSGKGLYREKFDIQSQYKFSIAFENDRSDCNQGLGYVTEKLTDPMLAWSIPIYWGNIAVASEFNTKSFISLHDWDYSKVFDRIKVIDQDDDLYFEMLRHPWLHGNELSKYLRVDLLENQFIKIFGE